MSEKDIVSKQLLKRIALDIAHVLFGLEVDDADWLESESQRVEDRRADMVLRAWGRDWNALLHIEIQNDNQTEMPWRMLRYRTDLALAYPGEPIRQYLVYIGRSRLSMPNGIEEDGLSYRYTVVDMHQVDCAELLAQDSPESPVVAILCDFKEKPERMVVRYILERLRILLGENEARYRDYLLMLEVLSTNRSLQKIVQEEENMLSQTRYSDLPSYHIGMQHGMQEGLQEGVKQGKQEGTQEGEAAVLLRLMERRFSGRLTQFHRDRIQQADAETLLRWSDRILDAADPEDVFQA